MTSDQLVKLSDVTEPAADAQLCRPRLTRGKAGLLLVQEEWRRHRVILSHGLAFWIWLFLIPGETAQLDWVLSFSLLWTGLVGSRIGGYDLEHGVDPLVRTLAPPLMSRWAIRAGLVVAAGLLFHILGCMACEWRWANELWGFLAKGPFIGGREPGRAAFDLLEALPIVCAVGLSAFAFTNRFNGVGPTILIVCFIVIMAVGVTNHSGEESPIVQLGVHLLSSDTNSIQSLRAVEQVKLLLALISLGWSGMLVFLVGLRYARRAPIRTFGRADELRWHWLPPALVAGLVGLFGLAEAGYGAWNPAAAMWTRNLLLVQLSLFGLWLFLARPWVERPHSLSLLARSPVTQWVRNVLVAVCLSMIGWNIHTRTGSALKPVSGIWPAPLSNPMVTSSQTWDEAAAVVNPSIGADFFDLIVWIAYETGRYQPLAMGDTILAVPAKGGVSETAMTLELPGSLRVDSSSKILVQLRLDRSHSEFGLRRVGHSGHPEVLHLSAVPLMSPAPGPRWVAAKTWADLANWGGPVRATRDLFGSGAGVPRLVVGVLVLPQKRDAERTLYPWRDFFTAPMLDYPNRSAPYSNHPSPGGILGMTTGSTEYVEPPGLRDVRLPLFILLTLVAASWRHWMLGWVAVVTLLLVTFIVADAILHRGLRRIVENRGLPVAQRIEAQRISATSYFHSAVDGAWQR